MKIIGLTGASGSGKSVIAKMFGFPIVDADKAARAAVEIDECLESLVENFGEEILNNDKTLNRKELAKRAFAEKEKTNKLNEITHPFIIKIMNDEIDMHKQNGACAVVLDAPQLFEAGCEKMCDVVIGVLADKELRKKRIIARDNISEKDAVLRFSASKSDEFFIENCDYIIINNDDIEKAARSVAKILEEIGLR